MNDTLMPQILLHNAKDYAWICAGLAHYAENGPHGILPKAARRCRESILIAVEISKPLDFESIYDYILRLNREGWISENEAMNWLSLIEIANR